MRISFQRVVGLFKLPEAAGNLHKIAGLEKAEGEADTSIAPATQGEKAAEEKGQPAPGGGDKSIFEALMSLPVGSVVGVVAMAEQALGFPGGVVVVLGHVAVDAAQVAVIDAVADQAD